MHYDAIVIGGGPAGLSAALTLGRSRRKTLLLDAGEARNERATASHGFLSRDGVSPAALAQECREQLSPYDVEISRRVARTASVSSEGFVVALPDATVSAKALILATGVRDVLPPIAGVAERWGRSVHHCPYCHGWECRDGALGIVGRGPGAQHLAVLLQQWSKDLILFTNGPAGFSEAERSALGDLRIEETPIAAVAGPGDTITHLLLQNGTQVHRDAIFLRPEQTQGSNIATDLGCALMDDDVHIAVDENKRTSVEGVYAIGDMSEPFKQQIVVSAASGLLAVADLNRHLAFGGAWR